MNAFARPDDTAYPRQARFDFAGATVAVTGAAQGIGFAVARRFVAAGARVALLDSDADALSRAVETLRVPERVQAHAVDVSDPDALTRVAAAGGPVDVLVNCAGVLLRGAIDDADAALKWQRTLEVNLGGIYHASRAFLPGLRARRGAIVNVASIHSLVAVRNSAAYTAAKGGVKQLTQALALELGADGVRVNAVAPGSTDTRMNQAMRADPAALDAFLARIPLGRTATPDEVAHAVLFLASDAAAYITGTTLPVDGGYCAN